MTLALLEILIGLLLGYCALICVKFLPALFGRAEPGTHCTGSLFVVAAGGLGAFLTTVFAEGLGGILAALGIGAAARAKRIAGGGRTTPTPTPAPPRTPTPTPEPVPVPGPTLPGPGEAFTVGPGQSITILQGFA